MSANQRGNSPVPMPRPGWKVVGQQQTAQPDANNQFVNGVNVTGQLQGGPTFTVFVPHSMYQAATVQALLQAKANEVWQIQNLAGDIPTHITGG